VTKAPDRLGLRPEPSERESFAKYFSWRLSLGIAEEFRDLILDLSTEHHASGSETLQCGTIGEVPVKISHGEFTDDFLMPNSKIPS
jgi:hypothetical protein